ncbi:MAG: sigma 54-interacting transcriptional regulator [Oscillospiraceae bacterium]|nr:sigma 54-interacting transcriptional regulator [Oscillospiraceae bacterium]
MQNRSTRSSLSVSEPMTVAIIATYPKLSSMLKNLVKGTNITIIDIYASFDDAVQEARRIADKVDIIISKGGTGKYIKDNVPIPVVLVPISPFDLLSTLRTLPEKSGKVAFVNYQRPIFETEQVAAICGREIVQYQFHNHQDLEQLAAQVKADGCTVYVGGAEGVKNAALVDLPAVEIEIGEESAYRVMQEAVDVIQNAREEKKRALRLRRAFDALAEGICVADEEGKISVFNPALARMFGMSRRSLVGQSIYDTPVGSSAIRSFDRFDKRTDQLEQVRDITVNANHIPIYLNREFIGTVSTYQDVSRIQLLEGQIRRQLSQKGFVAKYSFDDILGTSPGLIRAKTLAGLYARTTAPVLLEGESGTGKELFAHSIHNASKYASGPFVTVNCAAIPEQLLESELFGYAPGAFTGARKEGKPGLFELAHNGTIFLDEIGEMPKYLQSRLLRVLQEKEIMRVGDNKITSVNCRIISATNKNLLRMVQQDEFRQDLYYRLSVFTVEIPPLRERGEDLTLLCRHFLGRDFEKTLSPERREELQRELCRMACHDWPGNIRELKSYCDRLSLILSLQEDELSPELLRSESHSDRESETIRFCLPADMSLRQMHDQAEALYIDAILARCGNNHSEAARQLGIGRTTLWRRLEERKDGKEE